MSNPTQGARRAAKEIQYTIERGGFAMPPRCTAGQAREIIYKRFGEIIDTHTGLAELVEAAEALVNSLHPVAGRRGFFFAYEDNVDLLRAALKKVTG